MRWLAAILILAAFARTNVVPARADEATEVVNVTVGEIASARPGAILRIWPQIGGGSGNAKAYRILYRSTGLKGEPIAVSGAIFIPNGPAPHRRRDIIAWAHPTTGIIDRCAPTLLPDLSGTVAGLEEMMRRGFVVAATDYQGLGVKGMHPYLIGTSEARSVLDSVRAARELPDAFASDRFAVWGHSQGGHAALFTGEEAAGYAPELKLVGVAAAAPATYLVELFRADRGSTSGSTLTAMALMSWSTIFNIPTDTVLAAGAKRSYEAVAETCMESISEFLKLEQLAEPLERRFLSADPAKIEPWRGIMVDNSPGERPTTAPVFIAQGTADTTVRPEITRQFADHLCSQGTPVLMKYLEGVSHVYAGYDSANEAIAWMSDRFRDVPPPTGCPR
jgi:pimeloyl-ACP methyl ester carboxylesterase